MEPNPRDEAFAIIRMDPVATVRHLDDPEALRAAEALNPRSYLVYLLQSYPLPMRGPQPWHTFSIHPIAPRLRPANDDECITPEMCTPIWPNSAHPEGRAPLRTDRAPVFPFDNCYFWSEVTMKIRVCPRAEGFDWDAVTEFWPGSEYSRWRDFEIEDENRRVQRVAARRERLGQRQQDESGSCPNPCSCTSKTTPASQLPISLAEASAAANQSPQHTGTSEPQPQLEASSTTFPPEPVSISQPSVPAQAPGPARDSDPPPHADISRAAEHPHSDEETRSLRSHTSAESDSCSISIIASTDITTRTGGSLDTFDLLIRVLSDPDDPPELQPLFHLDFDLAANMTQEEIPDPVHLFEERDAIVRIIQEARARNPDLPPLPIPTCSDDAASLYSYAEDGQDGPGVPDAEGNPASLSTSNSHTSGGEVTLTHCASLFGESEPEPEPEPAETKPSRRRFRPFKLLSRVGRGIRSLFHVPYVPVWP